MVSNPANEKRAVQPRGGAPRDAANPELKGAPVSMGKRRLKGTGLGAR